MHIYALNIGLPTDRAGTVIVTSRAYAPMRPEGNIKKTTDRRQKQKYRIQKNNGRRKVMKRHNNKKKKDGKNKERTDKQLNQPTSEE